MPKDEPDAAHETVPLPDNIHSIDYTNLYSEGLALTCAYNAGIIDDLVGEETRLTLLGRMTTDAFNFIIRNQVDSQSNYPIHVENAQCEIDAGFESRNYLVLVEAKNLSVESFIIRQLYYPYRLWHERVPNKQIVPILMVFSDDIFTFYRFTFDDPLDYSSIRLDAIRRYKIAADTISETDVSRVFSSITPLPEPSITFPQADRFENILDLLASLDEGDMTKNDIIDKFSFVSRQANYYTDAARYLGLVDKYSEGGEIYYALNKDATALIRRRHREKYLGLIRLILERPIFHEVFQVMANTGVIPPDDVIVPILEKHIASLGGTTLPRRAQTVRSWIKWIWKMTNNVLASGYRKN